MIVLAALALASLTPADWFVERAVTVGACERFYAVDRETAEAKFDRELIDAGFSNEAQRKLRHARDEGRTMKIDGYECVVVMERQTRPSYMAKYGVKKD